MTEPFEILALTQSGSTLSGQVKYPAANTAYVLRTYFAGTEGGADYLVDEQTVADPASISVTIPTEGALAPTGEYYPTSFLMAEKTFTLEDGTEQTVLAVIDSQMFDAKFAYTNINQPSAPADVALEFIGNEVMRAEWNAVDGADGYAVAIYQQNADGSWADTGFGYDLNSQTTSIDMALTVGGNGVSVNGNMAASVPAEKLSADKTYTVGVRAYRSIEGGSYYSAETASGDVYLPAYTPLEIALEVGGEPCGRAGRIYAENDGSFTISGTLEEEEANTTIPLHAQDGAGNASAPTFTMPDGNVTVTAVWMSSGGSYTSVYPITVLNATNGTVAASHKTAPKGATITLTIAPDKGFAMDGLAVADGAGAAIKLTDMGNGKYTFIMPASKVTVEGSFKAAGAAVNPFVDVLPSDYCYDAVLWAVNQGVTSGGLFGSNQSCTRGQIVTFLYRTYNK